ncbi:MAG: DUF2887 domain-containing protein [Sphaerospermopsis kisseleviana]
MAIALLLFWQGAFFNFCLEVKSQPKQQQILEIIETILIYKFPRMKREEIESRVKYSNGKFGFSVQKRIYSTYRCYEVQR